MSNSRGRSAPEYKMVLVVRGELRLTPGKAAVQVAHAAVALARAAETRAPAAFRAWWEAGQRKIALVAPTLTDLEELERRARQRGLPTILIEDAGFTEVAPGTKTCLGIGPARSTDIDPLTGSLPLL